MTLGSIIKKLREREGIQQKDFAKKIGVSNVVLSRYESDERKPDYDTLQKIADYFDVTTDYLLGRSETSKVSNTKEEGTDSFTYNGQEFNLNELTPDQRILIDWAISRESLSFKDKPQDLYDLLDRIRNVKPYIDELEKKNNK